MCLIIWLLSTQRATDSSYQEVHCETLLNEGDIMEAYHGTDPARWLITSNVVGLLVEGVGYLAWFFLMETVIVIRKFPKYSTVIRDLPLHCYVYDPLCPAYLFEFNDVVLKCQRSADNKEAHTQRHDTESSQQPAAHQPPVGERPPRPLLSLFTPSIYRKHE